MSKPRTRDLLADVAQADDPEPRPQWSDGAIAGAVPATTLLWW
jgi:hypothetical protein